MAAKSSKQPRRRPRLHLYVILFIGALLVVAGTVSAISTAIFASLASRAPAVIDKVEKRDSESSEWVATFTFTDSAGRAHERETTFFSLDFCGPGMKAGDRATALYDPAEPEKAEIDSFSTLWLTPLLLCGGGLFACAGAGGMLHVIRRTPVDPPNAAA